jgi:hypothetical protein
MLLDPLIVAKFWISMRSGTLSEKDFHLNSWVDDLMMSVFWDNGDPEYGFEIVLAIHQMDKKQEHIEILAAGPVEDLLVHHGSFVIDKIVDVAKDDPGFARVLGGVWKSTMSDDVWHKVESARDSSSWD